MKIIKVYLIIEKDRNLIKQILILKIKVRKNLSMNRLYLIIKYLIIATKCFLLLRLNINNKTILFFLLQVLIFKMRIMVKELLMKLILLKGNKLILYFLLQVLVLVMSIKEMKFNLQFFKIFNKKHKNNNHNFLKIQLLKKRFQRKITFYK